MRSTATIIAALYVGVSVLALTSCDTNPKPQPDMRALLNKLEGPEVGSIDKTLAAQAEQAVSVGDFRRASQIYKQLYDEHPGKREFAVPLADSLRRAGDNELALKVIDEYLKKDGKDAEALEIKGLSQMNVGDFAEASKTLDKVMNIDGKRWRTLNALGIMFAIKKMEPQAIEYYTAALDASPDNPGVLNNLGLSLAMDKQYDKAIETFTRAKAHVDNKTAQARHIDLDLALVYALSGRLDDAEAAASPHLNKAELYNNMAFYAYISKNNELAKAYLNMALTQDPAYYERAWKNLNAINGDVASEGSGEETIHNPNVKHTLDEEGDLAAPPPVAKPVAANEAPQKKQQASVSPSQAKKPAMDKIEAPREEKPVAADAGDSKKENTKDGHNSLFTSLFTPPAPKTDNTAKGDKPAPDALPEVSVTAHAPAAADVKKDDSKAEKKEDAVPPPASADNASTATQPQ